DLPVLVALLAAERTREPALGALRRYGDAGFDAVAAALVQNGPPHALHGPRGSRPRVEASRWSLPRALASLDPVRAAPLLLRQLPEEREGMVRYRILRALELLTTDDPSVRLDPLPLWRAVERAVSRAYRTLDRELTLVRGAAEVPSRATEG